MLTPEQVIAGDRNLEESICGRGKEEQYTEFRRAYREYTITNELSSQELEQVSREYCQNPTHCGISGQLEELVDAFLQLPNLTASDVPTEKEGPIELDRYKPENEPTDPVSYREIGECAGILDPEVNKKIAAEGFPVLFEDGARLRRYLVNYMITSALDRGYREVSTPAVVNEASLYRSGGFPAKRDGVYSFKNSPALHLNPTAGIAVTNLVAQSTLQRDVLPQSFVAYSRSYRREREKEVGPYDTRHEFSKVELFKAVHPDRAEEAFHQLISDAKSVLEALELPHREILLDRNDMGIAATRTHDLEVYLPSDDKWMEVSSCSYLADFEARRLNAEYVDKYGEKRYIHTVSGSGLAVPRVLCALLEWHQDRCEYLDDISAIVEFVRELLP